MSKSRKTSREAVTCFCGKKMAAGDRPHLACTNAWGLDYDPTSERDAQRWLALRRRLLDTLCSATGGAS